MQRVGVVGAGTMGHGIAQVAAMAGCRVRLFDAQPGAVDKGLAKVRDNLEKGVEKGKVAPDVRDRALSLLEGATSAAQVAEDADIVVEAIPERLDWKQSLFRELDGAAGPSCVFATNTSSLSVKRIASAVRDPGRVIGTHFFNPVHVMALLEVVVTDATRPEVLESVRAWGARLGKECIVVRDFPGFATSRLGVCLGMEAIRMVEQGVASPEDIDKAMVLGYRHPVGPLKLTDMVGLDVRLAIGEYLARELGNAAFQPPELMRRMVAEGKLGQKSGQGFYSWK
jgi:3-hydroxybutyryl-CoA dehydrogenase